MPWEVKRISLLTMATYPHSECATSHGFNRSAAPTRNECSASSCPDSNLSGETGSHLPLDARSEIIAKFSEEMRSLGAANFLYFDGLTLFAHSHRRTIPGNEISSDPGLYLLHTEKGPTEAPSFEGLNTIGSCAAQAMVATMPLDDQRWRPLSEGVLLRLQHGALA